MKLITLHFIFGDDVIKVNPEYLCSIQRFREGEGEGSCRPERTRVVMDTSRYNHLLDVKETPDEIESMIDKLNEKENS